MAATATKGKEWKECQLFTVEKLASYVHVVGGLCDIQVAEGVMYALFSYITFSFFMLIIVCTHVILAIHLYLIHNDNTKCKYVCSYVRMCTWGQSDQL